MMTTAQAQTSLKNLNSEFFSLTPSALITLYEIDLSDLYADEASSLEIQPFRFHNSLKLTQNNIIFNDKVYVAAPIFADNFEFNSKGAIATPKISLTVQDSNSYELTRLKQALKQLGDLRGAKLTRRKTFAKFLDAINWSADGKGTPNGFTPDPNAELASDIYFFSRKSADNKSYLEYEMSSVLDLDSLRLPQRTVLALRCTWTYRSFGCFYEYDNPSDGDFFVRRNVEVHGSNSTLRLSAPPVATAKDELILGDIFPPDSNGNPQELKDLGAYDPNTTYQKGNTVFITKNGVKYYFVAKFNGIQGVFPPSDREWAADECSKSLYACRLRPFQMGTNLTVLNFGSFPSVAKINE